MEMAFNRDKGTGQQVEQEIFDLIVTKDTIITIFNQQHSVQWFIDVVPAHI
jgi:hypothetical protein